MRVAAAHGVLLISITFFGISDGGEIESTSSILHQIDLPPAVSRLNQCKPAYKKLLEIKGRLFNLTTYNDGYALDMEEYFKLLCMKRLKHFQCAMKVLTSSKLQE